MKMPTIKEQKDDEIIRMAIFVHAIKTQQPIKYRLLMDILSYLKGQQEDDFAGVIEREIERME